MIGLLRALLGLGASGIAPREAMQRMERGAVLVDVREPDEFAAGHAPGATLLPLSRIRGEGATAPDALRLPAAGADILLVCQRGVRSRIALAALAKAGHRCTHVDGGMAAWTAAGLPLARR